MLLITLRYGLLHSKLGLNEDILLTVKYCRIVSFNSNILLRLILTFYIYMNKYNGQIQWSNNIKFTEILYYNFFFK